MNVIIMKLLESLILKTMPILYQAYSPNNETDFNNNIDIMNNNHNHFGFNNQTSENMNISVHKDATFNLDILRVPISHRKCCICHIVN